MTYHPSAPPPLWRRLFPVAATLFLAVWFFSPTRQVADPTLDTSNYASFAYFTAHGFQFGTEVLHVGGPYGFVHYGFVYNGSLFWKRLPLELFVKLVFSGLAVWLFQQFPRDWRRWLWMALLLYMAPLVADLPYDLAILLSGLCLMETHPRPGRKYALLCAGLAAYLALLTLIKGTHAMLALATLGLLAIQAGWTRRFSRLLGMLAAYGVTLIVLLLSAGQNPLNFPAYLRTIIEQSAGYNSAMVIEEPTATFAAGLGAFLALESAIGVSLLARWRSPVFAASTLLLAGFTFVEWKHGFVRADGHVYIFFQYACIAAPTIILFADRWTPVAPARRQRFVATALAGFGLALGFWGDGRISLARHTLPVQDMPGILAATARQLITPARAKAELDAQLAAQRRTVDLPLVREIVGAASIDFFGAEHGYLPLNQFNYRPRPMSGGNFSVFNAWLQDRNLKHVSDPAKGPEYFLVRPEIFDDRFMAQDDAGTLRALLACYSPIDAEQDMVLFQRTKPEITVPVPRLLRTEPIRLGDVLEVPTVSPNELLAVELDLPLNLWGRLRAALYKAPVIRFDLEGENISYPTGRRAVPGLFSRPVILYPVLENTMDLLGLYQDAAGKRPRKLKLHTKHPHLFDQGKFMARYYTLPRPRTVDAAVVERLSEKLHRYPVTNVKPVSMEPPNAPLRRFNGLLVQMLEPPGRIRFALQGRENEVRLKFGLDPEAYLRGETDGVDFLVELERPGQPPQNLFRRLLKPGTVAGDRGTQLERVWLPPHPPDSFLVLRTDIGPDRNGAWDWAYFSGIRLLGDGYRAEQFPRFQRLPVAVDGATVGSLEIDGRKLFMLNAPGVLTFALDGTERNLAFSAGLLPGAYANGGQSDGVEFMVELRTVDGTMTTLASHRIDPGANEAHRGDQTYQVPLPPVGAGAKLTLRITTGPHGNGAWDWSYISALDLH